MEDNPVAGNRRASERERRLFRARFVAGYVVSYTIDAILLGLFAAAGTVPVWVPIAYFVTGSVIGAVFGWLMLSGISERSRDPYFTAWQTFASSAALLVFLAIAPEVGFLFLCALFIVFGFGGLRMSPREALIAFALNALGAGGVLLYAVHDTVLPYSTLMERALVWTAFVLILARLTALGLVGSALRIRAVDAYRQLKASNRELEDQATELIAAREAVADANARHSAGLESERTRAQEVARLSEERFRSLLEMSSDFYWESDAQHRLIPHGGSEADASRLTQFYRAVRFGERRWEAPFLSPDEAGWQAHRRILDAHRKFRNIEISRVGSDGVARHLSISGDPVFDADGNFAGYRGVGTDISERRHSEQKLHAQTEKLRLGQSLARLIVLEWNVADDTIEWSDSPEWLRGPLPESGKYPVLKEQIHPEDRENFLEKRSRSMESGESQTVEYRFVRTDGQVLWIRSRHQVSAWQEGRPSRFQVALLDITDFKQAQERIQYLAYRDHLTGLPNRALLRDRLERAVAHAIRSGTQTALLFIDLDNFKTVNDSLGHQAGDALLKSVAETLQDIVRPTDTVSRQGGDEFIVVLTDIADASAATPVLEKMFKRFASPFRIDGEDLIVSASVGVARYPDDGGDFDVLLKKADVAMYRAKESGKNTYRFYDEPTNRDSIGRMRMRGGLRSALENGEFTLHYQPQVDLHSGSLVGAEALIRWNSPQRGMVAPGLFIPVAEESGLIVPIGEWVVHEACRQASAWRKAGLPAMVVAVNLSADQFRRGNLEKTVVSALESSGLDPSMLELELTESILIRDTETTLATVRRLKALGVTLSIDDFGTGYSSLSYLKRFAVDKLKIDQSFIRDLARDPEDAAIVRAIIQMAHSLELRTIAEGVEREPLLDYLRSYNCDEAQGYHFARPMPADEFESFLARSARDSGASV